MANARAAPVQIPAHIACLPNAIPSPLSKTVPPYVRVPSLWQQPKDYQRFGPIA
jgi:hypothetical protein